MQISTFAVKSRHGMQTCPDWTWTATVACMNGGIVHGSLKIVAIDHEIFHHSGKVGIIRGGGKASDAENMLRHSGYSVVADSK
jgi:hypothetical protein